MRKGALLLARLGADLPTNLASTRAVPAGGAVRTLGSDEDSVLKERTFEHSKEGAFEF